jgi:hypothetical protein
VIRWKKRPRAGRSVAGRRVDSYIGKREGVLRDGRWAAFLGTSRAPVAHLTVRRRPRYGGGEITAFDVRMATTEHRGWFNAPSFAAATEWILCQVYPSRVPLEERPHVACFVDAEGRVHHKELPPSLPQAWAPTSLSDAWAGAPSNVRPDCGRTEIFNAVRWSINIEDGYRGIYEERNVLLYVDAGIKDRDNFRPLRLAAERELAGQPGCGGTCDDCQDKPRHLRRSTVVVRPLPASPAEEYMRHRRRARR